MKEEGKASALTLCLSQFNFALRLAQQHRPHSYTGCTSAETPSSDAGFCRPFEHFNYSRVHILSDHCDHFSFLLARRLWLCTKNKINEYISRNTKKGVSQIVSKCNLLQMLPGGRTKQHLRALQIGSFSFQTGPRNLPVQPHCQIIFELPFFFFFFYYFLTSWCFICLFFFFLRIRFFSFFFPSTLRFSFNEMDQKLIASLLHLLWTFNGILQTTQTQYQNGHFNLPLFFLFCLQYP